MTEEIVKTFVVHTEFHLYSFKSLLLYNYVIYKYILAYFLIAASGPVESFAVRKPSP